MEDFSLEQYIELTPPTEVNFDSVLQTTELLHLRQGKIKMSILGKLDEFLLTDSDWAQYMERMDQFFIANGRTEEPRKKTILLSSCGAALYSLLRNLVAQAKLSDKNYESKSKEKDVKNIYKTPPIC